MKSKIFFIVLFLFSSAFGETLEQVFQNQKQVDEMLSIVKNYQCNTLKLEKEESFAGLVKKYELLGPENAIIAISEKIQEQADKNCLESSRNPATFNLYEICANECSNRFKGSVHELFGGISQNEQRCTNACKMFHAKLTDIQKHLQYQYVNDRTVYNIKKNQADCSDGISNSSRASKKDVKVDALSVGPNFQTAPK